MPPESQPTGAGGSHGLIFAGLLIGASAIPSLQVWPVPWVAAIGAYFGLVALVPSLKTTAGRMQFGRLTPATLSATVVIAISSWVVLTAFQKIAQPDLSNYSGLLPVRAMGGIVSAGIIFSVLNALLEEIAFRVVLFEAVERERGTRVAVVVTAALFGLGHLHGYPPGVPGALLAGVFGLALGWLRAFTGGIGLPVAAHIAADATIFTIVAGSGAWPD